MTRFLLRPRAQRDIDEIWNYTATTWSPAQAEIYIRQIQGACEALASNPRLGRPCEDVRARYRKYRSGSHFIFYLAFDDGVDVVRILHQSMDFDRHV